MIKGLLIILTLVILFHSCTNSKKNENDPPDLNMSYRLSIDYILNIDNEDYTSKKIDALKEFKKLLLDYSQIKLDSLKKFDSLYINFEISLIQDQNLTLDKYILSNSYEFHKSEKTNTLEKMYLKIYKLPEFDNEILIRLKEYDGNELKKYKGDELKHYIKITKEISELFIKDILKKHYYDLFDKKF